jgi:hypothetical protein
LAAGDGEYLIPTTYMKGDGEMLGAYVLRGTVQYVRGSQLGGRAELYTAKETAVNYFFTARKSYLGQKFAWLFQRAGHDYWKCDLRQD